MNDRSSSAQPLRTRLRALAAEAILDAAEVVFAEQGLNAGMDAIAGRAGVAVGTIYNHFGDRESLVRALLEARANQMLAAVDEALAATADRPFRPQLVATLGALARVTEEHAAFRRMCFQAELGRSAAERLQVLDALAGKLAEVLRHGEDEGVLAPDPRGLRPALLMGLLHAAIMLYLRRPERLAADQIAEVVAAQFLDGAARRELP